MSHTTVIFGSGPGIGNHITAEFASHGLNHVILLSRNMDCLASDKQFISSQVPNTKVSTLRLDLSNLASILEVLTTPVEEIEESFKSRKVITLKKAFADSGVFIGLVIVEGIVALEKEFLNPKNIAEKTWGFYEQGEGVDVKIAGD
ncbi:uncharacterized protein BDR25DRAFT_340782 [Lindgomyces ingoldianus]|uniref:Uncharacterized protein n=1 Tax=Lindgomyces ingoldianus TaxID=673940 RepID=A0ACB6R7D6_9PLEO|nr:uncharacterized protein BDR25DRAFT_340782 [Lindgomyces ingoldianus]KAF2474230.1 hypothetical protein BDR25DRAFT_340782 [Lindgomyces ingoldianus]